MILNSFSEVKANTCPDAFQDLNRLNTIVPNEEERAVSRDTQQPFLPLHMSAEPDYIPGEDTLVEDLQSPFLTLTKGTIDQVNQNGVLRYLNIARGESDAETYSKLSTDSPSSRERSLPSLLGSYQERDLLSISDVCSQPSVSNDQDSFQAAVGVKTNALSRLSSKTCKVTQTSKFCHICVRSGEQAILVPCANVVGSVCRKAMCQKCFDKHGFAKEWVRACESRGIIQQIHNGQLERLPDDVWTCLHCRQMCPASAQCKIYTRTNRRRHLILKQRKAEKNRMIAKTWLAAKELRARKRNAMAAAARAVSGVKRETNVLKEPYLGGINIDGGKKEIESSPPVLDSENELLDRGVFTPLAALQRGLDDILPFSNLMRQ